MTVEEMRKLLKTLEVKLLKELLQGPGLDLGLEEEVKL